MKCYKTPTLVVKGDVVALTQGAYEAMSDPGGVTSRVVAGSIGFGL
jgi:hypothetical protein